MDLASLGAGAAVAVALLTTVFAFLLKWQQNKMNNNSNKSNLCKFPSAEFKDVYEWTKEMHRLHDKTDEDGVPVWYVSRAHLTALQEIQKTLAALQMISDAQFRLLERIEGKIKSDIE